MRVLGIDPGTATTGYGFVEVNGHGMEAIEFDLIETSKEVSPELRLAYIYQNMRIIIERFSPEVMAIEKVFFSSNRRTAINVSQALGVMLLSAADANIQVVQYAPGTIKKLVAGDGRADKKVIQRALRDIFGAKIRSRPMKKTHFDNAADALAVAVCHIYTVGTV
ncbi:crossover junction endodeoxyribonuclease RuvC [Candidatus Woesebacteria bacterium RIFCSPHIGHO2_01_FULL_41_10]|uniref:Crossover junction endodeoxyribonuclease RuvC n=1 Tax=Candidatus Woesebacteria bacterium RIFCSPHIGHO2_01_FULL_41_10 TaxID=1802500 RepID=A0A1F7YS99_9BACT|nr:MAG: crossover junction endodeoxyribonuclease RuvC [Candidatus Woesebacteria bacterium RIFCSPHIGHO2_01_FULL_41_10]